MVAADGAPLATVVIPVLNDAAPLAGALASLHAQPDIEIVVVNGCNTSDPALDALRTHHADVTWTQSAPGRGLQMNAGARLGRGRWLVFLHADTRLGDGWTDALRHVDDQREIVGGSFRFALDSPAWQARWIERGVRIRIRLLGLPYGDQALFARRAVFDAMGGYLELPLMEDVEFIRRLRRRGRLAYLDVLAMTSARRWERDGWVRRTVGNAVLLLLYSTGQPPERLARRYHRRAVAKRPAGHAVRHGQP